MQAAIRVPGQERARKQWPVPGHRRSRRLSYRSRREMGLQSGGLTRGGQVLHADLAAGCHIPLFRPRCLVMRPDAGALEKAHAERDAALLGEVKQPFPDALLRPAE